MCGWISVAKNTNTDMAETNWEEERNNDTNNNLNTTNTAPRRMDGWVRQGKATKKGKDRDVVWRRLGEAAAGQEQQRAERLLLELGIITHALRRWGLGLDRCCHCVQLIKTKPFFLSPLPFSPGLRPLYFFCFVLFCFVSLRGRVECVLCCACAVLAAAAKR
jgi:hypothetical protein